MFFEKLGKILYIEYSAMKRDRLYLQICRFKQLLGKLHPLGEDIIGHRLAGLLLNRVER